MEIQNSRRMMLAILAVTFSISAYADHGKNYTEDKEYKTLMNEPKIWGAIDYLIQNPNAEFSGLSSDTAQTYLTDLKASEKPFSGYTDQVYKNMSSLKKKCDETKPETVEAFNACATHAGRCKELLEAVRAARIVLEDFIVSDEQLIANYQLVKNYKNMAKDGLLKKDRTVKNKLKPSELEENYKALVKAQALKDDRKPVISTLVENYRNMAAQNLISKDRKNAKEKK